MNDVYDESKKYNVNESVNIDLDKIINDEEMHESEFEKQINSKMKLWKRN